MKIWARYLLKKLTISFCLFLLAFFLLYVTVDLSLHGAKLIGKTDVALLMLLYYLLNFSKNLVLFFPLTFLLASLKTLLDCNTHHELIALQMAGLSKKKILAPFFATATALALLLYANNEWIVPASLSSIDAFHEDILKRKKASNSAKLYQTVLPDQTDLVYQTFDPGKKELFDVLWIEGKDKIWHCKYVELKGSAPLGLWVDAMERAGNGKFTKTRHFDRYAFPHMDIDIASLQECTPPEYRPLSRLIAQALWSKAEKHQILAHLHYKIATPLVPLILLFFVGPLAMRFKRQQPILLMTALSLLLLFSFFTILDGMLILGENQVLPSWIAIWGTIAAPFLLNAGPIIRSFCLKFSAQFTP